MNVAVPMDVDLMNAKEWNFLVALEKEIDNELITIESVSEFITTRRVAFNSLNQRQRECLTAIAENKGNLLQTAAKYGNTKVVQFLIACGVNVNALAEDGEYAVDKAFRNQKNETLLVLLEADSNFPLDYSLFGLSLRDDYADRIDELADERNDLHRLIADGNLDEILEIDLGTGCKYLNTVNQSALFNALDCKQFHVYAYLKCNGAIFRDDEEKLAAFKNLGDEEKEKLEKAMVFFFKPVQNAHIYYLISKSRSQKPTPKLYEKLKDYYETLNEIPEISCILKVAQYAEYLDIVFDFDEESISNVCPTFSQTDTVLGLTKYTEGRIYIGAGSSENEALGTLAHELTHLAMHMVYRNGGNPYKNTNEDEYNREVQNYFRSFSRSLVKSDYKYCEDLATRIILHATSYGDNEHASELVARISQIMIEIENGKQWLEHHPWLASLFSYYQNEILNKDCYDFILKSFFAMESKNALENQTMGELKRLQSFNIRCVNVDPIKNFLKQNDKSIFIYKVESTMLGLFKLLQGTLGPNYLRSVRDNPLVLRLECFIFLPKEIQKKIYCQPNSTIIFEGTDNLENEDVVKICKLISKLPNKIIFVVNENVSALLKIELIKLKLDQKTGEMSDDELTLFDLDEESQKIILERKIIFQGRETPLKEFIGEDMYEKIQPGFIEDLLRSKKPSIGSKLYGISSLEGAYADIFLNVDFDSFKNALAEPKIIFIVEDKHTEKYGMGEIIKYLKNYVNEVDISIYHFHQYKNKNKQIVLADRFSDTDFEKFCHDNPERMIYWIKINDLEMNSFRLQKLYDPDFYVKRRIRRAITVTIDKNKMHEMVGKHYYETFIISGEEGSENQKRKNLIFLNPENANAKFGELIESKRSVHLLQKENGRLVWKKSYESMKNLRPYILKDLTQTELIEETDLIKDTITQKVLLIADNPGMGKSTTLTRLYTEESIVADHWIVRINLRNHSRIIVKEIDSNKQITTETVIRCLREVEPDLKTTLNSIFLESLCYKTGEVTKSLLIAFDGFDEILDECDRKKIIKLLKFIKYETPCKFWITTRLHHKELLENELSTFAVELEPFDDEVKKTFIKKYFKERLNLILDTGIYGEIFTGDDNVQKDTKIWTYTEGLFKRMTEIFQEDISKFIGTPLQLNLVLSGSATHFQKWVENNEPVPNFLYLGKNLLEVYKMFIQRKYNIYFSKVNRFEKALQKSDKVTIENYHYDLAQSLILKSQALEPNHVAKEMVLLLGIVQTEDNKNFEFVHFTFREFYCAQVYIRYLCHRLNESDPCNPELEAFLFDEIFEKKEYELIRRFINLGLGAFPKSKISQKVCQEFATKLQKREILFHAIATEGCQNIFSLLYFSYKWNVKSFFTFKSISIFDVESPKKLLLLRDSDGNPLFYSIIKGRNRLMLTIFLQEIGKLPKIHKEKILFNHYKRLHGSILHLAQMFNTFECFVFMNEKIKSILRRDKQKNLLLMTNCVKETILHQACIADDHTAMMYILRSAKQLLNRGELKHFAMMENMSGKKALDLISTPLSQSEMEFMREEFHLFTFPSNN